MHHYGEFISDNDRSERDMNARNQSPVSSMSSLTQSSSSSSSPANLPLLLNSNEDEPLPANTVNKIEAHTHQAQLTLVEIVNNLYSINSKKQSERDDEDEDTTDANESAQTQEIKEVVDAQVQSMQQSACLMPNQAGLTTYVPIAPLPKLNKLNACKSLNASFGSDKKLKKLRPNLKSKDGLDEESGKGSADLLNKGNLFRYYYYYFCIKVHLKLIK